MKKNSMNIEWCRNCFFMSISHDHYQRWKILCGKEPLGLFGTVATVYVRGDLPGVKTRPRDVIREKFVENDTFYVNDLHMDDEFDAPPSCPYYLDWLMMKEDENDREGRKH